MVKNQKGQAVALTTAYNAVTQMLGYSHKKLQEETGLTYSTLRKIRDGKLGKRSPVDYYRRVLMEIMCKEYRLSFQEDGGTKAIGIKNVWAQIGCELSGVEMPEVGK